MTSLLLQYLTRFNYVKLASKKKGPGPKDMSAHFQERLLEDNRGKIDPAKRKSLLAKVERLVQRMNANPKMIEMTGKGGKVYTSSAEAVRALPNQIGIQFPGVDGYTVLENRRPPHLSPQYTINTHRSSSMGLRSGTTAMTEKALMSKLIPEWAAEQKAARKAAKAANKPGQPVKDVRERFGYTGKNWKSRWASVLSEINSKKEGLNAARAALGEPPLPAGTKITSLKPGPQAAISSMPKNQSRKLTKIVLRLAAKGKLKLGFANAQMSRHRLIDELALRRSHQNAFSSFR